jgi:hypothetical protein
MVCDNTLIRVYRDGVQIEVKRDLSRFEERFYDFIPLDFEGLPIIVSNFTCYKVAGNQSQIFLIINPKPSVVRTSIKKQYLVLIDINSLKAHECQLLEDPSNDRLTKVFFFEQNGFLGQTKVNSSLNRIIKYEISKETDEQGKICYNIKP